MPRDANSGSDRGKEWQQIPAQKSSRNKAAGQSGESFCKLQKPRPQRWARRGSFNGYHLSSGNRS